MKNSRFNIFEMIEDGALLYNTNSNGILKLNKEYTKKYNDFLKLGKMEDEEFQDVLLQGNMIVDEDECEIIDYSIVNSI